MAELKTTSLLGAWRTTVAASPSNVAVIEGGSGRSWTRADLNQLAEDYASRLPAAVHRQRVGFALPNGSAWLAVFLGLLRAGATPLPLDPSEPTANQRALALAARAAFLWLEDRLESIAPPVRRRRPVPALIKLTSGSTGHPRALPFTHAQMLADGGQVCASMEIAPDDVNLAVVPFGHSYGLGNLVIPLIAQGTALVCADIPLPHALASLVARHRPTIFPAVPTLLRALAEADLPADAFKSIRTVISAGAPLPPAVARSFFEKFHLKPRGFYGSSETGGITYDRDGDDTLCGHGAGSALIGVTLTQLPRQRIRVRSAAVLRGGAYIPADRARLESGGRLVLLGRTGHMVKVGGRRLDLGELENALRQLPAINDAFVTVHPENPDELAAVLATFLTSSALRRLLRAHLASWKIPRRLVPVTAFPANARGKTDASALRELLRR